MYRIAIIGPAHGPFTKELWVKMYTQVESRITDWSQIHLVSGGAAWSDHIAVYLYRKHPECKLTLHFPCLWVNNKFLDTGVYHWAQNPGKTANTYHEKFSFVLQEDSFAHITAAIGQGAQIYDHYKGFHARNLEVGKVDMLIAFGFHGLHGGTYHTWQHSSAPSKIYIPIP